MPGEFVPHSVLSELRTAATATATPPLVMAGVTGASPKRDHRKTSVLALLDRNACVRRDIGMVNEDAPVYRSLLLFPRPPPPPVR